MVQFPTSTGEEAGRWCPDGKGLGHHVPLQLQSKLKVTLEDLKPKCVLSSGGTFSKVFLVEHAGALYALKRMPKKVVVQKNIIEQAYSHKAVYEKLSCPFIVPLLATFQDKASLYMMMEPVMGGDLFGYLSSRDEVPSEDQTRFYAGCVIFAFEYMHSHGYMYRNLCPENLLIDSNGYLKLNGYSFAKKLPRGEKSYTIIGVPDYVAPEMTNGNMLGVIDMTVGHDHSVDWWGLGVLIFEMLTTETPFGDENQLTVLENIRAINIQWSHAHKLTAECKDLIQKFLTRSPTERLGCREGGTADIKQHPWFAGFQWDDLSKRTMTAPYVPPLSGPDDTQYFGTDQDDDDLGIQVCVAEHIDMSDPFANW